MVSSLVVELVSDDVSPLVSVGFGSHDERMSKTLNKNGKIFAIIFLLL